MPLLATLLPPLHGQTLVFIGLPVIRQARECAFVACLIRCDSYPYMSLKGRSPSLRLTGNAHLTGSFSKTVMADCTAGWGNSGNTHMTMTEDDDQHICHAPHEEAHEPLQVRMPALKSTVGHRSGDPIDAGIPGTSGTSGTSVGSGLTRERRATGPLLMPLPRAVFVSYMSGGLIHVGLDNHCAFVFPASRVQALASARAIELRQVWIEADGQQLHWPRMRARVSLPDLMRGILGSPGWMRQQAFRIAAPNVPSVSKATPNRKARTRPALSND
ncbi:DUF2442 domain-containing protein [Sphaerotilus mobilis]|uniref:Uncharacterized protein DUF2442 n=1 Tax=Sphaerotilus mobilis TaxID=47994 RepID=A0A4Q7LWF4_9BURK|nr:DUF2442 domain-containing protein [Sphaerotilus mobilis]RZS58792.1 uncharacterized protein DUF2442 [Sphaerotilus mobilis]